MVKIEYTGEITLEQILAFDPENPETYTRSEFINAVCLSFAKNGYKNCKDLAKSLGLDERRFSYTFEVLTGMRYAEIRPKLVELKAKELVKKNPHWGTKRISEKLGFRSLGSLWSMIPKESYHQLISESKAQYLRRMAKQYDTIVKHEQMIKK